jgi:hypothetical protein
MRRHHLSPWQVYADQLLLILGYFMLMVVLLVVVPHVKQQQDGLKPKAEYLVTLTWGDHRNIDLDLWLKHEKCVVAYLSRECVDIGLDRDSRGYITNASINPDGSVASVSPNQEVIAIRSKLPGDYLTAVNYYDLGSDPAGIPVDCTVELIKLNPTVEVMKSVTMHFDAVHQTINAIAFHIDPDGAIQLLPTPALDLISSISLGPTR